MQLDFAARELTVKLVYYGPALSGKTTNLHALHRFADESARGRLMTLETRDDRTLFFDLLPLRFKGEGDLALRLKLFTVPGQVIHSSTRRLVLQGADGVAFIADSQLAETQNNASAFLDLKENLKAHGVALRDMPLVIQYNKRDLPSIRSEAELVQMASRGREPVFAATATRGDGVLETFISLLHLTWTSLDAVHDLRAKFKINPDAFLGEVSQRMGATAPIDEILLRRLGGTFTPRRRESAP
ncbi:MAG TPA: GTPase domain-containing protein [Polyangiaceae bacterium]|nr:GTPase domain-containing protein [Polyangiaceae bacterium]